MANMSIGRLISLNFRGHHHLIKHVAVPSIGPSWSQSLEEMRLSANHVSIASNVVCTPNMQLDRAVASHYQDSSPNKGSEALCSSELAFARLSFSHPLVDMTAGLRLLSLEDRAVRLPSFEGKAPMTTPTPTPISPQQLPQMPGSTSTIVEPYEDLLPRLLPSARESTVLECINMVRLRRKKMKKHKRKKAYKRNRVSHEHRILMDIIRKEKLFMLEQTTLLNEAEQFSAEQYVADKIKTYQKPVPKFWKGKKLPQSVVMKLMRKSGVPVPGYDD